MDKLESRNLTIRERRQSLLTNLNKLRDTKCLTDITLVVSGQSFAAHRILLAANSSYFRDVFRRKPKINRITIRDIDADVFGTVLQYFYSGRLRGPAAMDPHKVAAVMAALKSLKALNFTQISNQCVLSTLSVDTYYELWQCAKNLNQEVTERDVAQFVAKNLSACSERKTFAHLSLQDVVSIMSSACLRSVPPDVVMGAVLGWCDFQQEKRHKYLPSILAIVGLKSYAERCKNIFRQSSWFYGDSSDSCCTLPIMKSSMPYGSPQSLGAESRTDGSVSNQPHNTAISNLKSEEFLNTEKSAFIPVCNSCSMCDGPDKINAVKFPRSSINLLSDECSLKPEMIQNLDPGLGNLKNVRKLKHDKFSDVGSICSEQTRNEVGDLRTASAMGIQNLTDSNVKDTESACLEHNKNLIHSKFSQFIDVGSACQDDIRKLKLEHLRHSKHSQFGDIEPVCLEHSLDLKHSQLRDAGPCAEQIRTRSLIHFSDVGSVCSEDPPDLTHSQLRDAGPCPQQIRTRSLSHFSDVGSVCSEDPPDLKHSQLMDAGPSAEQIIKRAFSQFSHVVGSVCSEDPTDLKHSQLRDTGASAEQIRKRKLSQINNVGSDCSQHIRKLNHDLLSDIRLPSVEYIGSSKFSDERSVCSENPSNLRHSQLREPECCADKIGKRRLSQFGDVGSDCPEHRKLKHDQLNDVRLSSGEHIRLFKHDQFSNAGSVTLEDPPKLKHHRQRSEIRLTSSEHIHKVKKSNISLICSEIIENVTCDSLNCEDTICSERLKLTSGGLKPHFNYTSRLSCDEKFTSSELVEQCTKRVALGLSPSASRQTSLLSVNDLPFAREQEDVMDTVPTKLPVKSKPHRFKKVNTSKTCRPKYEMIAASGSHSCHTIHIDSEILKSKPSREGFSTCRPETQAKLFKPYIDSPSVSQSDMSSTSSSGCMCKPKPCYLHKSIGDDHLPAQCQEKIRNLTSDTSDASEHHHHHHRRSARKPTSKTSHGRLICGEDSIQYDHSYLMCVGQDVRSLPVQACYDLRRQRWRSVKLISNKRIKTKNTTLYLHKRCLYYFGGHLPGRTATNLACVRPLDSETFKRIASMSVARSSAGATHWGDELFIVGGFNGSGNVIADVEQYSPETNQWKRLPNLRYARSNPSLATAESGLYVVSGFLDEYDYQVCFSCELYSFATNQWNDICTMPTSICSLPTAIANVNNHIYLIRPMRPNKVYQYIGDKDEWRLICQCSNADMNVTSLLGKDGQLWVIDDKKYIFKFNFESEAWLCVTLVPDAMAPPVKAFVF